MQVNGRENLAEESSIAAQPIALSGPRPTLERIRVEEQAKESRRKRVATVVKIAYVVAALSVVAIAYALLR